MASNALDLDDVVAGYGRGDVLRGLCLQVPAGEITCLVGPNGSGKSTVLRVISGLITPSRGRVRHNDVEISGLPPRRILERGVAHIPQDRGLFPAMSVWDNVLMGAYISTDRSAVAVRIDQLAERFPIIRERRSEFAGSLSGGEQKIVEIVRALMLDPAVLCFDEPSIGLEPRARRRVFDLLKELNASGRTILLVEQNARSGLEIAHYGAVLDRGVVHLAASGSEILSDHDIGRLYLGAAN
jgi:branched-chain amino acid transport system ATP-binding protein